MKKEAKSIWERCLSIIKDHVTEQAFITWFKPIVPLELKDGKFIIQVPSQFHYEWLEEHYRSLMEAALMQISGEKMRFTYLILMDEKVFQPPPTEKPFRGGTYDDSQLNERYTFSNFVEGNCNRFAKAACLAVAKAPGKTAFNPLLIYGGVGLGKTHLIQAIGNFCKANGLVKRVRYVPSEKFTLEFINSIQNNRTREFSSRYRSYDLLLIDDIHFFVDKEQTQQEFFHTFNELYQKGKQIVLTSDRPPNELKGLEERLISRFNWGLIAELQPPDLETRIAILQKKAEEDKIDLPQEIIFYIASKIESNIRELEGGLIKILAYSSLTGEDLSLELAKTVLKDIIRKQPKKITIDVVKKIVCDYYKINKELLEGKTRKKEVVLARQVAMYLARELTNSSLETVGLYFGGRDHSTVIHACKMIEEKIKRDKEFDETIKSLKKKIQISS